MLLYDVDQYYNKREFSIISGHAVYRQHPAEQTLHREVSARKQGLCQGPVFKGPIDKGPVFSPKRRDVESALLDVVCILHDLR